MDDERSLLDWLQWPLLILIVATPLRFALEVAGIPKQVTQFFSSTVFVYILAIYLGVAMAREVGGRFHRLLGAGFALGYVNGFMTLIATLLSTYASLETHYRHHNLNVSDAQHILMRHIVLTPLYTSLAACVVLLVVYYVAGKIRASRKRSLDSTGDPA
ncbi:MAG: hypothetical protein LAO21_13890 [Acidobacteriia bacterium]|nr:hypothetical protein [Terriglobia bacterium]